MASGHDDGGELPTLSIEVARGSLTEAPVLVRGDVVGRYVVLEGLGRGGMSEVYAAYDPELDRKVALKLMRVEHWDALGALRLRREAQALARLSHPNVVAVHDVGQLGDQIFVAMEYVRGQTLRQWCAAAPRPWPEILDRFVQAATGLAAAHQAGLVHRDFKPSNVIISDDGRVRVLDFGLARFAQEDAAPPPEPPDPLRLPGAPAPPAPDGVAQADVAQEPREAAIDLTQAGVILGTPRYMAPEQVRGQRIDAAADQFSFCAALFEALHGEHPFEHARSGADAAAVASMQFTRWRGERRREVPGWLDRVIDRGLQLTPAARYPSMRALILALTRPPRATLRRGLVLSVGTAVVAALIALAAWPTAPRCGGSREQLLGIWDAAVKQNVHAVFARGGERGERLWRSVDESVDRYAESWVLAHTDACEATHQRAEQSLDLLDRRMACLARLRTELSQLVAILSEADTAVISEADRVVRDLRRVDGCSGANVLSSGVREPEDPRVAQAAAAIRGDLSRVKFLGQVGKFEVAQTLAEQLAERAAALEDPPLRAEALYWLGRIRYRTGSPDAEGTLRAAFSSALAHRHDEIAARAAVLLVWLLAVRLNRVDEALRWADDVATAVVERLDPETVYDASGSAGTRERFRSELQNHLGVAWRLKGDYTRALDHLHRGLEIQRSALPAGHELVGYSHWDLAELHTRSGDWEAARAECHRAHAVLRAALDVDHVDLAAIGSLCLAIDSRLAMAAGDLEKAAATAAAAAELYERALGSESADYAWLLTTRGDVARGAGQRAVASGFYERAAAIVERALGPRSHDAVRLRAAMALASDGPLSAAQRAALHECVSALPFQPTFVAECRARLGR